MSTDSFNLAPAEAGATLTAPQPVAPQTTTETTPKKTKKKDEAPGTPADGTLAGAVIPGAALTGLIGLCWMIHQFGLPAVLAGVIACALAASAALVAKARRGSRSVRNARKNALGAAGGGGGLGGGRGKGGGGYFPRSPAGGSSFGSGSSGRKPSSGSPGGFGGGKGGSAGRRGPGGPAAMNSAGMNAPKGGLKPRPGNSGFSPASGRTGAGGTGTTKNTSTGSWGGGGGKGRIPNQPKHRSNSTTSAGLGSVGAGGGGNRGGKGGPGRGPTGTDRLNRIRDRKHTPTHQNHNQNLKPLKAPKNTTPTHPSAKNETKRNRALKEAARKNGTAAVKLTKGILKNAKRRKETEGTRRQRQVRDQLTKTRTKVKRLKQHHKAKAELKEARADLWRLRKLRITTAAARARNAARPVTRRVARAAAHVWRFGSHTFTRAHMLLGTIRYTDIGPNWARPLAKLLHTVTSPVARLIHASGTWGWLNKWMYRNTTTQPDPNGPRLKPVSAAAVAAAVIREHAAHQAVNSPWEAPSPKGTPMSSSLSGAMPLAYAAEAVRNAGILLITNPSANMAGYEATIRQLSDVQAAISQVIQAAAVSTREDFAVNPVISDAYDDTAMYGYSLAERLDAIPALFRMVHAEQLENLENPTIQAAKWDIGAHLND
ncbi:hypothetical protein [Streptomyces sp. NPDC001274]